MKNNLLVVPKFSYTDRTGCLGHVVELNVYKKVFVKDQDEYVVIHEIIMRESRAEYIFSSIRHNINIIKFLDKEYALEYTFSKQFNEYYESIETQEQLKAIVIDDVLKNTSFEHLPNVVDFGYGYQVFEMNVIKSLFALINT